MKKVIKVFIVGLFFLTEIVSHSPAQAQVSNVASSAFKKAVIPISNIEINSPNFDDLNKLIPILKNVRVLGLGENTHDDGNTFKAKIRLIKFLHKYLGFEIVAFESSFLGGHLANLELDKDSTDFTKVSRNLSGWFHSEIVYPLLEYAKESRKTKSPLILAGFDDEKQPNAVPNTLKVINQLYDAADWINIGQAMKIKIDSLVRAISGQLGDPYWPVFKDSKSRYEAVATLKSLLKDVENNKSKLLKKLNEPEYQWLKFGLKSFLMQEESFSEGRYGTAGWNMRRDNFMSKKIQWLIDSLYSGKKIIVWAATGHLARNFISISRNEPSKYSLYNSLPFYQTGDFLHQLYGDKYYSIGFMSYEGEHGLVFSTMDKNKEYEYKNAIPVPEPGSFEDLFHQLRFSYSFCNLRNKKIPLLYEARIAHPFGYTSDWASWPEVIDGFFFIDTMEPDINRLVTKSSR